jgi:hypothetical protein
VLSAGDIERQYASLVSVMLENLLDALTKEEIAYLFAFLEAEPKRRAGGRFARQSRQSRSRP